MGSVKFELNRAGVGQLLKSAEMRTILNEHAAEVLGRLPGGYGMRNGETSQRAKTTVYTDSIQARIDNSKNNSLLKALGGGS